MRGRVRQHSRSGEVNGRTSRTEHPRDGRQRKKTENVPLPCMMMINREKKEMKRLHQTNQLKKTSVGGKTASIADGAQK